MLSTLKQIVLRSLLIAMTGIAASSGASGKTVAFWNFEEGMSRNLSDGFNHILDSSGNGNIASMIRSGPHYCTNHMPSSKSGGFSMYFDGVSPGFGVQDNARLYLTRSLTIEAAIKPEPLIGGSMNGGQILFRGDNRPGLDPYYLVLNSPGNLLVFGITDGNNQTISISHPVEFDRWQHVAGTLDDTTGVMSLYIDGIIVATTYTTIRPLGSLSSRHKPGIGIGSDQNGDYGEFMHGWIGFVRLSDTALNPQQFLKAERNQKSSGKMHPNYGGHGAGKF
jgi:hypothetical protein